MTENSFHLVEEWHYTAFILYQSFGFKKILLYLDKYETQKMKHLFNLYMDFWSIYLLPKI